MKILFSMSFRGDKQLGKSIYSLLEELGYKHLSDSWSGDIPLMFYKWKSEKRLKHYKDIFKKMHQAQIVVLESSIQSMTIGQMLQDCLDRKIPVLVLVREKTNLAFLDGLEEEKQKLVIGKYSEENLKDVIENGLELLSEMIESRFTMILSAKLTHYLDEVAESGMSRSEYIRDLIERDMKIRRKN